MTGAVQPQSYRSTLVACYIGTFVQSIVINLTPILFIPLRTLYGLSFSQLGLLVFINFTTQVACDLIFSKSADRHGFRPFIVTAHALTVLGFVVFALSPQLLAKPYPGLVLGTIIFSGAGGLLELLLSPIVDSIPTDGKSAAMSLLHSFYAWGQVVVVLLTTFLLFWLGSASWPWIVLLWTIPPACNFFLFRRAPMAPRRHHSEFMRLRDLIRKPAFILACLAILFGGASELVMNQWTSAFMEKAANLPKIIGDVAGMTLFAVMLGVGRLLYSILGTRLQVNKAMIWGSVLAAACYLVVALSPWPALALAACALSGLAVSLFWPGSLVVAAARFPLGGAAMFAIMAAAGDVGAAGGPWLAGVVSEMAPRLPALAALMQRTNFSSEQFGLRAGLLVATLLPLGSLLCHLLLRRHSHTGASPESAGR